MHKSEMHALFPSLPRGVASLLYSLTTEEVGHVSCQVSTFILLRLCDSETASGSKVDPLR